MNDKTAGHQPAIPDQVWDALQRHLGYDDDEMEVFRADPRNARILAHVPEMASKTIVFEVIESRGCNAGHVTGTRLYFSAAGTLISKMAPSKVCAFALPAMAQAIYGVQELIYAGSDPNSLCFKRGGCFDVGLRCGGWGRIVFEASVIERTAAERLWAGETGPAPEDGEAMAPNPKGKTCFERAGSS